MFTRKLFTASLLIVSLFLVGSCSDDDKYGEGPKVTITKPSNDAQFTDEDIIEIECEVEVENGISSYKVDIHWAGNHTHDKMTKTTLKENISNQWTYTQVYETEHKGEKKATLKMEVKVPKGMALGEYHLGVSVIDQVSKWSAQYIDIELVR